MHDAPEFPAGEIVPCRSRVGAAAVLKSHLHNALVLTGRFEHLPSFPDGIRWIFLDVHVLAGLAGADGGQRMPVLRRGNDHGIDVFVIKRHLHVGNPLRRALLHAGEVGHDARSAVRPNVTDILEFHARQPRHIRRMDRSPPPRPNKRQHDSVGWTLGPNALRHAKRSRARGHGDGRLARRLKKTAASDRLRQLRIR